MQDEKPQGRKGTLAIKPDKLAARVARKTKGRRVDEKYKNPLPWKDKGNGGEFVPGKRHDARTLEASRPANEGKVFVNGCR